MNILEQRTINTAVCMDLMVCDEALFKDFDALVKKMIITIKMANTIFVIGNGGSMAQAMHLVGELVGRFENGSRPPLRATALTDISVLSALVNDFHPDQMYARQLEGSVREGDLVILLSTSGKSENILQAVKSAHAWKAHTVAITGSQDVNVLRGFARDTLVLPSQSTAQIQELTLVVIHALCQAMDEEFS